LPTLIRLGILISSTESEELKTRATGPVSCLDVRNRGGLSCAQLCEVLSKDLHGAILTSRQIID